MHRPSATDEFIPLRDPMKICMKEGNSVDSSAPGLRRPAMLAQQRALAAKNAHLVRESMIMAHENAHLLQRMQVAHENMLMRLQSQGWSNSMPYAHPGLSAPPGLCSPPGVFAPPDPVGIPSVRSTKVSGNASTSTVSGESGSASPSVTDDDEMDEERAGVSSSIPVGLRTTVMMRNLPNNLDREQLLQLMNEMGFEGVYNLVYLPMDFKSKAGLGYAFIDFKTSEDAQSFFQRFEGFDKWAVGSDKVCNVSWSTAVQGIDDHLKRYRNSPVMHPSVPDEFKPVLFKDGERVPFPEPTKRIRAPRDWPRRP